MAEFKKGQGVTVSLDKDHSTDGESAEHTAKFVAYHLDRQWADVELEAEHAGGTKRLSVPVSALKALLVLFAVLCSPLPSRAQYLGNVGLQTVDATLATNLACTGAAQNFTTGVTPGFSNLGQTSHAAYLTSSNIAAGTMVIQGSMDGVNFQNISEVATIAGFIAGTPNSFVVGSGRYTIIRVSVNCNTAGAATFSLSYSGSQATPGALYGSQSLTQYDKNIVTGLPMGSNFTSSSFQPPFGNSFGTLYFKSLTNPPAGSTIAVQCAPGVAVGSAGAGIVTFNNPIAVTTALQTFQIPSQACSSLQVAYTSGGASANAYYVDYLFGLPGTPTPSTAASSVNTEGQKASYRSAISFAPPAGGATDIFVIGGSATKTVRVTHVGIACTATAAIAADILFIKRSAADTGGTATPATLVPLDANDPASTSTVNAYTANPTINGTVGNISADKASITTTTGAPQFYFEDFGIRNARTVVLRGTAQQLAINLNNQVIAGLACDAEVEWTEE